MPNNETLLHEVRQRINYEELFREFLPSLRGRGRERMALCPFHENTDTPAFSVNVEEGVYQCRNPACDAHGDFVDFYRRVRGNLRFPEAVAELARRVGLNPDERPPERDHNELRARNDALLAGYVPPTAGAAAPETEIDAAIVQAMHDRLLASESEMRWLAERRGITQETVVRFKLGHDGQRYYIPIYDEEGRCVNIRRYKPNARRVQDKMISWRPGFGKARLWPLETLAETTPADGPIFLLEGEMDCLLALQNGLRAITTTGGAGTWRAEWNEQFRDRDVIICYDNDLAGRAGGHKVARELMGAAHMVRMLTWPYAEPAGFDFTDYIHGMGQTVDDFIGLVNATPTYRPPPVALVPEVELGELPQFTLAEAGRAEHRDKDSLVALTISGIASAPSLAPKEVTMFCGSHAGTMDICARCPLAPDRGNGSQSFVIEFKSNDALDYVNVPDATVLKNLKGATGIPGKCPVVTSRPIKSINLLEAQAIPDVGQGEAVYGSDDYVTRRVYQQVEEGEKFIAANNSYRCTVTTVADPKTQGVVHIVKRAVPSQSDIDVFQMSDDIRERLRAFQPEQPGSVDSLWMRLDSLHSDLERVTRIYQRRDLMLAVDLTYMSPISYWFQGERAVRGWVEALIIGDSRTGKTTIVQRLLRYYRSGEFSTGENTSFAGLVGGLNELNRSWFTRWGKVPLNDRRLLVIDEAGNLPHEQIARMSSMRSSGIAEIVKIHAERTNARTRQIWISNPRSPRPLSTYSQGVLAVKELIGAPEDIARFDLVVTAASGDVSLATINAARSAEDAQTFNSDLCHQRVMWAWSRKPDQIDFTDEATAAVLDFATRHGETYRYATEIPLVEPNEQRVKLARLSAAAAATFFSTDDGESVTVRPEHVEFVYQFLNRLYEKPSLAFHDYARMQRRRFELQGSEGVRTILTRTENAMRALMEQEHFTQSDLQEILGYDERSDLRGAITKLRDSGFLRRVGSSFYVKTPAAITWLRTELAGGNPPGLFDRVEQAATVQAQTAGDEDEVEPPW